MVCYKKECTKSCILRLRSSACHKLLNVMSVMPSIYRINVQWVCCFCRPITSFTCWLTVQYIEGSFSFKPACLTSCRSNNMIKYTSAENCIETSSNFRMLSTLIKILVFDQWNEITWIELDSREIVYMLKQYKSLGSWPVGIFVAAKFGAIIFPAYPTGYIWIEVRNI